MTREQVEAELGKPFSVLQRGDMAVLRHPNDGRVELTSGRLVRVVRVWHASDPATAEEVAAEEEAKAEQAEADPEKAEKANKATDAAAEAELAKAGADARKEMESAVERMSADSGQAAAGAGLGLHDKPSHFWRLLAIGAVVQVVVGMGMLKLAFRRADVHADWIQMLWPVLAGMAGGVIVLAVGYGARGTTQFSAWTTRSPASRCS